MDDTSAAISHLGKFMIDPCVKKTEWESYRTWTLGKTCFLILGILGGAFQPVLPRRDGLTYLTFRRAGVELKYWTCTDMA